MPVHCPNAPGGTLASTDDHSRHQVMLAMSPAVIYACRPNGDYGATFISDNIRLQLGYEPSDFTSDSQFWVNRIHQDDRERILNGISKLFEQGLYSHEYRFLHSDGSYRWMRDDLRLLRSPAGEPTEIIGSWSDITERKNDELALQEKEACLQKLLHHDPLTGLANRSLCRDRLEQAVQRSARDKKQLALMFVDLDQFKRINDILGHHTGDKLLQAVAIRIQSLLRSCDSLSRFGGDEFVIVVDDFSSIEQVAKIAQKILDGLNTPFDIDGRKHYVTASIGIAIHSPEEGVDGALVRIMKRADVAMFAVKEQGRNNFLFYSAEMDARAHEYLLLENDLRQAIELDQFVMHYQPQIDLATGQIIGLEALIRWQHPTKGLLTPGHFIPLAETSGLMVSIGSWALRTACAYAQQLSQSVITPLRMSINISPLQFKTQNFPEKLAEILAETGLDPHYLELEITESIAMEHTNETISRLSALREMGVKLSIDDFGKGYSSLSYLKHLPVTTLKIDMAFVREMLTNQYDAAIVEAILTLAKSLNMEVIAEGIENHQQHQALRDLGCKLGQGYLFSHPVPPEELCKLFNN